MPEVSVQELRTLLLALESAAAEFEQLELDKEWFVSDSIDLQKSGAEIVRGHLGMHPDEEDTEHGL